MDENSSLADLVERYEIRGEEATFVEAKRRFEAALAERPDDVDLLTHYGYLLECHARSELRASVRHYTRAIELDPANDRPRWQLISAMSALFDHDDLVGRQRERVAASPDDVRELRFLAAAYLRAGQHGRASEVLARATALAPEDASITYLRGEAAAHEGRIDEALAEWRHSADLDPGSIGGRYMSAYLLEREGRLDEAASEWRWILEWNVDRGHEVAAEFPRRELARVSAKASR